MWLAGNQLSLTGFGPRPYHAVFCKSDPLSLIILAQSLAPYVGQTILRATQPLMVPRA